MIVMGGKPKDDSYDKDSYEDKEEGSHDKCKCSCCGMPCPKCSKESDEDSEDDSEEESDEDSEDYK
jgi:hypothetical protein